MKQTLLILVILLAMGAMLFAADKDKQKKDKPDNDKNQPGMMMQQPDGKGPMSEMGMGMPKNMMKELNLSKDQMKSLEGLKTDHQKLMNTKKAEIENLMIDKRLAMKDEKFDQAKSINKSISDDKLLMENATVDFHAALLKALTPEQKDKFMQMMPMGNEKGMEMRMKGGMGKDKDKGKCKGMDMQKCKGMNSEEAED